MLTEFHKSIIDYEKCEFDILIINNNTHRTITMESTFGNKNYILCHISVTRKK